jgi:uncharacterized protein YjdB
VIATSGGARGERSFVVKRQPVARVTVDRSADTLWLTRSHDLRARVLGAAGESLADRPVSWVSLDTSIVSIVPTSNGVITVRGGRLGTTKVIARSEGVDTAITMAVVPIPVARIELVAPDTVYLGKTRTIRAQAYAPDGVPLVNTDLAGRAVAWTSDRPLALEVSGQADDAAATFSGLTASAYGRLSGTATVTASLEGASGRSTVITARAPVAGVRFVPKTVKLRVGESMTLAAAAVDLDGMDLEGIPLTYGLASGADVLGVTQTKAGTLQVARLDARTVGTAQVTVTAEGRTGTLPVTVTAAATPVRVFPTAITAAPGAVGRLMAIATDATGTTLTSDVTYRSSDPAVVTVDGTGRVTMVAPGTASVTATAGTASAKTDVTVVAVPKSTFHIQVLPAGTVPPEIMAAAQQAAARWERLITTELPATEVSLTPGECATGVPAVHHVTTGLVVYVAAQKIDGARSVLAYAGPCIIRDAVSGGLPSVGTMTIDLDDIPLLTGSTGALAADVVAHEMGHILGIGTLWYGNTPATDLVRSNDGDLRFGGAAASAAAVRLGVSAAVADGVAVEDAGGIGTAGGHWRERVFLGELMTGYVGTAPNPLSIVTVQSLRDIGYQVTETGADIVSPATIAGGGAFSSLMSPLGGPSLSGSGTAVAPFQIGERLLRPRFVVDRNGRRTAAPQ